MINLILEILHHSKKMYTIKSHLEDVLTGVEISITTCNGFLTTTQTTTKSPPSPQHVCLSHPGPASWLGLLFWGLVVVLGLWNTQIIYT